MIFHHNWPWCAIHMQIFFLLFWQPWCFCTWRLCNFVIPCPHALFCVLYLKNEEEKRKNEAFSSEKEEPNPTRALIFYLIAYNESSYLQHHMVESKSVSKWNKTQDFIAKTCNRHLTHALSTHIFSMLDLAKMSNQKKIPHLRASFQLLRFIYPTSDGWNLKDAMWTSTPHTLTKRSPSSLASRRYLLSYH